MLTINGMFEKELRTIFMDVEILVRKKYNHKNYNKPQFLTYDICSDMYYNKTIYNAFVRGLLEAGYAVKEIGTVYKNEPEHVWDNNSGVKVVKTEKEYFRISIIIPPLIIDKNYEKKTPSKSTSSIVMTDNSIVTKVSKVDG